MSAQLLKHLRKDCSCLPVSIQQRLIQHLAPGIRLRLHYHIPKNCRTCTHGFDHRCTQDTFRQFHSFADLCHALQAIPDAAAVAAYKAAAAKLDAEVEIAEKATAAAKAAAEKAYTEAYEAVEASQK